MSLMERWLLRNMLSCAPLSLTHGVHWPRHQCVLVVSHLEAHVWASKLTRLLCCQSQPLKCSYVCLWGCLWGGGLGLENCQFPGFHSLTHLHSLASVEVSDFIRSLLSSQLLNSQVCGSAGRVDGRVLCQGCVGAQSCNGERERQLALGMTPHPNVLPQGPIS